MGCGIGKIDLDNIGVAAPCSAEWGRMTGDERVRHCALCRKNVYNLSEMTRAEAEDLIRQKEGKLCVRFYRRADGTMLTANCPVGLRAVQRRLCWIGAGVAALVAFCASGVWARNSSGMNGALRLKPVVNRLQNVQPFKAVIDVLDPPRMVMGDICVMPVPPKPAAQKPVLQSAGSQNQAPVKK